MSTGKMKRADGLLTVYGLSCGYIDHVKVDGVSLTRQIREGQVIHVRAYEFDGRGLLCWHTYFSESESVAAFKRLRHKLKTEGLVKDEPR